MWSQIAGLLGAGFTTACCLGLSAVVSVATALGAGFILKDELLFPLFAVFGLLSLWGLRVSTRHHEYEPPFWLGIAGAALAVAALWLLVSGWWPKTWLLYLGLSGLVGASFWDLIRSWVAPACPKPSSPGGETERRRYGTRGAAIAAAVGVVLAGRYQAVKLARPAGADGDVHCFGVNSCKGTTAWSTKWNACNGQNSCKGKGWLRVATERECRAEGGVLLAESIGATNR